MKNIGVRETEAADWPRVRGLVALAFVRELSAQGYGPGQVAELCTEIEYLISGQSQLAQLHKHSLTDRPVASAQSLW